MLSRPIQPSKCRRAIETIVRLLIGWILLVTWHLEWFVVAGDSMAPRLRGAHHQATCGDCGHGYASGRDPYAMAGKRMRCPNCGAAGRPLEGLATLDGDRLLVHKAAFTLRGPDRWEVAAFRSPADGTLCIKRVVGLPHEKIELREGDVYADGVIQRKPLVRQRAMAVLVHNDSFQPRRPGPPRRWQPETDQSAWRCSGSRYFLPQRPAMPDGSGLDWLTYRHPRPLPGHADRWTEGPITDRCGYNQTRPMVRPYEMDDLLLEAWIAWRGEGRLALAIGGRGDRFLVLLEPSLGRGQVLRNGRRVAQVRPWNAAESGAVRVELSNIDRQLLLAVDGKVRLCHPYTAGRRPAGTDVPPGRQPGQAGREAPSRPLAIGGSGTSLEVRDLRVWRDVYYTPSAAESAGLVRRSQYSLSADEYMMLGDNSRVSQDSRAWTQSPGVRADLLVGKPFLVHFPSRRASWRGGGIQVPDPARIRYIR